jgi:ABC-type glycerol-3-phosphate transport system substrate-binding protein
MNTPAVRDVFKWEAAYFNAGLYAPEMTAKGPGWSGSDIWEGFKKGKVFLSFMTQLDCFMLRGTKGKYALPGYIDDKSDLAVSLMPRATSLSDDLAFNLRSSITTGGWLWGISSKCRNPQEAYRLIRHLTSREVQMAELENFGILPVRQDLLTGTKIALSEPWKQEVYVTSLKQLKANRYTVLPQSENVKAAQEKYIDIMQKIYFSGMVNDCKKVDEYFFK